MHYMETYNASEGFFGIQDDPADKSMLLMLDYGVFYEFMEVPDGAVVPLWGVVPGKNYAMLITTSCGLWRYMIGDTVRFTSTNPYKFVISGRTKSFINAFGEELIVDNAEQGLAYACEQTGAEVLDYLNMSSGCKDVSLEGRVGIYDDTAGKWLTDSQKKFTFSFSN